MQNPLDLLLVGAGITLLASLVTLIVDKIFIIHQDKTQYRRELEKQTVLYSRKILLEKFLPLWDSLSQLHIGFIVMLNTYTSGTSTIWNLLRDTQQISESSNQMYEELLKSHGSLQLTMPPIYFTAFRRFLKIFDQSLNQLRKLIPESRTIINEVLEILNNPSVMTLPYPKKLMNSLSSEKEKIIDQLESLALAPPEVLPKYPNTFFDFLENVTHFDNLAEFLSQGEVFRPKRQIDDKAFQNIIDNIDDAMTEFIIATRKSIGVPIDPKTWNKAEESLVKWLKDQNTVHK